jgi:Ribbon-helix-helix protein, copG family
MDVTLSIDDDLIREATRRAEAMGISVDQLVRDYLEQFVEKTNRNGSAAEFERLSRADQGSSQGWKFNREELHGRK